MYFGKTAYKKLVTVLEITVLLVFKERTSLQHSKLCACCFVLVGQCITDEVIALITTIIIIIGMPISYTFIAAVVF